MSTFNLEAIRIYFEDLCEKHSDLRHNADGQRAFASLNSDEHIRNIQNHGTPHIVVISSASGQRIGDFDDKKVRRGLSIIFASKAFNNLDVTNSINTANNKAEEIMFDFLNKMDIDFLEECTLLQYFEPEKISWEQIEGPWLDNYYGWELFVPFKSFMPPYNAEKWL